MARPLKDGVDYFPKDTHFYSDDKVRLLRSEFGAEGMYLLDYLICDLYAKEGYYAVWSKEKCMLTADGAGCGISSEFVEKFVSGCIDCRFFDEGVFRRFGVLTSAGIQRRYIRMFQSREVIPIISEYWLLDINNRRDVTCGIMHKLEFKSVSDIKNSVKNTDNTQSKVKKKENKTLRGQSSGPPELEEVKEYVRDRHLRIDAAKFYYYYSASGWKNITDWRAKAKEWSVTERRENGNYAGYDIELFEEMLNRKD